MHKLRRHRQALNDIGDPEVDLVAHKENGVAIISSSYTRTRCLFKRRSWKVLLFMRRSWMLAQEKKLEGMGDPEVDLAAKRRRRTALVTRRLTWHTRIRFNENEEPVLLEEALDTSSIWPEKIRSWKIMLFKRRSWKVLLFTEEVTRMLVQEKKLEGIGDPGALRGSIGYQ